MRQCEFGESLNALFSPNQGSFREQLASAKQLIRQALARIETNLEFHEFDDLDED